MLSPDAEQSKWVRIEITYADTFKKRIFPILLRGDETNAIPSRLINHNFIDIRDKSNYEFEIGKLINEIKSHIENQIDQVSFDDFHVVIPGENNHILSMFNEFNQLPKRQKDILLYMDKYSKSKGSFPTIREIGEATGISSTSVVNYNLDQLGSMGYIEHPIKDRASRSRRIIKPIPVYDVFVSHSQMDNDSFQKIENRLQAAKLVYISSEEIEPNPLGVTDLQREIVNSRCMVIILSPHTKYSSSITTQLVYAKESKVPIIPVLVKGDENSVHGMLQNRYFDIRNNDSAKLELLVETILKLLGRLI